MPVRQGEGWSDSRIAAALDTGLVTVARVRQQLIEEGGRGGADPRSDRRPRPGGASTSMVPPEAELTALACSEATPKGRAKWTLRLLEDKVVELNIVARASNNTIGRTLKKTSLNRTRKSNGSSRRMPTPHS